MFRFDNTYARALEGTYAAAQPSVPPDPQLVVLNDALAGELGLDALALRAQAARVLSGAELPAGATPLAQAYAGHQFGGLSPQLGDGRALLLGEVVDVAGRRRDVQLKGSGRTPFSRGGDGKAALGPMLREYVMGEAMHALGIPTSRALAVVRTGEAVVRDERLPGAVLTRIAASHLRVGTCEYFAIRGDLPRLAAVVDYALARHYPHAPSEGRPALALFEAVRDAQASLVAQWVGVGFVHGVMNTDNVTLSGETIDYGPCAFIEQHDLAAVFSSIDHGGRYAYGNQPAIMGWNLARLASALLPLVDPDKDTALALAQAALERYADVYQRAWDRVLRAKSGLTSRRDGDQELLDELAELIATHKPDHTLFFRRLGDAARGDIAPLRALFADPAAVDAWVPRWLARLALDGDLVDAAAALDRVNPHVIARNHRVEEALSAAVQGDLAPFHRLVAAVSDPFSARADIDDLTTPAGEAFTRGYQTFCGT